MAIFDPQFREYMVQTVYRATPTGVNNFGEPTWGTPVAILSRVVKDDSEDSAGTGTARGSRYRIYCETAINVADMVWLPGADQTQAANARHVLDVVIHYTPMDGTISHYEVTV